MRTPLKIQIFQGEHVLYLTPVEFYLLKVYVGLLGKHVFEELFKTKFDFPLNALVNSCKDVFLILFFGNPHVPLRLSYESPEGIWGFKKKSHK